MNLPSDANYMAIHAPIARNSILSGLAYVPNEDKTVIIGADATITIGSGDSVPVFAGMSMVFLEGITYNFSASTPLIVS